MTEFQPVRTLSEFHSLDELEILEGYLEGLHGNPPPGSGGSRGHWHGWRQGQVDGGFGTMDEAQGELEQEFEKWRTASRARPM